MKKSYFDDPPGQGGSTTSREVSGRMFWGPMLFTDLNSTFAPGFLVGDAKGAWGKRGDAVVRTPHLHPVLPPTVNTF